MADQEAVGASCASASPLAYRGRPGGRRAMRRHPSVDGHFDCFTWNMSAWGQWLGKWYQARRVDGFRLTDGSPDGQDGVTPPWGPRAVVISKGMPGMRPHRGAGCGVGCGDAECGPGIDAAVWWVQQIVSLHTMLRLNWTSDLLLWSGARGSVELAGSIRTTDRLLRGSQGGVGIAGRGRRLRSEMGAVSTNAERCSRGQVKRTWPNDDGTGGRMARQPHQRKLPPHCIATPT